MRDPQLSQIMQNLIEPCFSGFVVYDADETMENEEQLEALSHFCLSFSFQNDSHSCSFLCS